MEAYKCDICGEYYTFQENDEVRRYKGSNIHVYTMKLCDCYDNTIEKMDLCPKCVTGLFKILRNKVSFDDYITYTKYHVSMPPCGCSSPKMFEDK